MSDENQYISRRNVLRATGVATAGALAGCGGGGNGNGNGGNGNGNGGNGNGMGNASGEVSILHAWGSGDGANALQALKDGFENEDVNVTDSVVQGAARSNLVSSIQTRMSSGNPPSTWQAWPGKNLLRFTADQYGDLEGDVWDSDLKDNYLEGPKQQAQVDGKYVAVPLNIHRINNLFYNTSVVEEAGVDPSSFSTPSDVLDAMETVASETDATPHAHANAAWTAGQLWETVLLAQAGQSGYNDYINGEGSRSAVESALEAVDTMIDYTFDDASSIGFPEASTRMQNGEAAFMHQGDWAAGGFGEDFVYGEDWDHVPFPGSEGHYALNMDSFPFPAEAPNPEATKVFLKYCGGTEAQIAFNREKGSIPPRSDADVSQLNEFQQDQYDNFTNSDAQPPSIQHGLAVVPPVLSNFGDAFSDFISNRDVGSTTDALMNAFN